MKFKRLLSAVLCVLMITSSLVFTASGNTGNESEIPNTLYKLTNGDELKVGYIGGSVTDGYGADSGKSWRELTKKWFEEQFQNVTITEISDAIGGTGMSYGLYRAQERYFRDGKAPDINFVEMAVNDYYDSLEGDLQYRYIESFIKKIYESNSKAEIIFVITGSSTQYKAEVESNTPLFGKAYTELAAHYGIPVIYVFRKLALDIYNENAEAGNQSITTENYQTNSVWNKYFGTDTVHPNDTGYAHYAETITDYLEGQLKNRDVPSELVDKDLSTTPIYCKENNKGDLILDATVVSPKVISNNDLTGTGFAVETTGTDLPDRFVSKNEGDTVMLKFNSDTLKLWVWAAKTATYINYSIDGGPVKNALTSFQAANSENSCIVSLGTDLPAAPANLGLADGEHIIKITHVDGNNPFDVRYFLMSDINGESAQVSVYTGPDPALADKTVTVTVNPENGGTVTVNGNPSSAVVENGTEVTVVANPAQGYDFVGWTEDGEKVSNDVQYTFNATANRNLVANFEVSVVVELPQAKGVNTIGNPYFNRSFTVLSKTSHELKTGTYGEKNYLYSSLRYDSASNNGVDCITLATTRLGLYSGDKTATKTFAFVAKRNEGFLAEQSETPKVLLRLVYACLNEGGVSSSVPNDGANRPSFEKIEIPGADFDLWICKVGPDVNSKINFNGNNGSNEVAYVIYMYDYLGSEITSYFKDHPEESVLDFVGSAMYENVDYTNAYAAYKAIYADIISKSAVTTDALTGNAYEVTYKMPDGSTETEYYPSVYQQNRSTSINLPVANAFKKTKFNLKQYDTFGFLGWQKNGAGETFQGGTEQDIGTGPVTYEANVIDGNSVKFDAYGGRFDDGREYVYKAVDIGSSVLANKPSDPTRTGYVFKGWSIDPLNLETYPIIDNNRVAEEEHETFKAVWEPIPGEKYTLSSLTIEDSKNDTINRKYVSNLDAYLGNAELNSENGITVKLPCGWPTNVMPQLTADSADGAFEYTPPTSFTNGVATGTIRIINNNLFYQNGDPYPTQSKDIIVRFEIEEASSENDITVNDNFTGKFGMSDKGYNVEVADKNTAPVNQIETAGPIKLTLNGADKPTNFTLEPDDDYFSVDDIKYIRILAYYDTGLNGEIDTDIVTGSGIKFGNNNSGNLNSNSAFSVYKNYSHLFLPDRWQYIYYDMTGYYGYTDSLIFELFGGKNASEYSGSDDSVYIAGIDLFNVDSTETLKKYKPVGIEVSSHAYEGQKGILSNLTNDMQISKDNVNWLSVGKYASNIGGTYSAGVLEGLDSGEYYIRHSALESINPSEAETVTIKQDTVIIKFHDQDKLIGTKEIAYSTTAQIDSSDIDAEVFVENGYKFDGWSTTSNSNVAETIIADSNKELYSVFSTINNIYVKADGTGDGLSQENPTSFANAWGKIVVNGGTITVIDTVDVPATVLVATDKNVIITGDTLNITAGGMNLEQSSGKITFTNIALTGTGTINLNGKEAEFTDSVTGAYTVCASSSADVTGKLTLRGGEPTVNVVGSVKLISSVEYTKTGTQVTGASVQLVAYPVTADCGIEFNEDAYQVTVANKYAVVTAIDGAKKENVKLISNTENIVLADGSYTVAFYDAESDIPVTVNIYDGTGHLETLIKVLGDTYSYSGSVTIPDGKIFTGFEGDGYTLGITGENTLSVMPENANINLYATFEFDSEAPCWFTVGRYDNVREIYEVDVNLAYAGNAISAGAVGLKFNVEGLTRTGDVVYNPLVTNIENIVYTNDSADVYVIAFAAETGTPIVADSEGILIATMTFTLSPEAYAAMDGNAFTLYTLDDENTLYNSTTDKWQIVSGTDENNIYAPNYVDSFVVPHETSRVQFNSATIELTVELVGASDTRTVTENIAKFGYRIHGDGDYTYVDLEEAGAQYDATLTYTISGREDFAAGVTYDIIVVKNGYISAKYEGITISDGDAFKATLVIGNLTTDDIVNAEDVAVIVAVFDAEVTDEAKGQADVNEDGFANVFDIAIVKDNYGKTSSDSTLVKEN